VIRRMIGRWILRFMFIKQLLRTLGFPWMILV